MILPRKRRIGNETKKLPSRVHDAYKPVNTVAKYENLRGEKNG